MSVRGASVSRMTDTDAQLQHIDENVRAVAAKLPFLVELEADMGGTFALQIELGRRGGADDEPDRAGIDPEKDATWWLDIEGGRKTLTSELGHDAAPAEVARWVTEEARREGSPATLTAVSIAAQGFASAPSAATAGRMQQQKPRATAPAVTGPDLSR